MQNEVIANKAKLGAEEALGLARQVTQVVVARGKQVTTFDMKASPPDDETLLEAVLGPTGSLRAPTIRSGDTLVVGFNEAAYRQVF